MLDENAGIEIGKVTELKNRRLEMELQLENDYGLYRNEPFIIPAGEGKWESFTSNRPSTDANKTINTLASARLRLKILLGDENEKQRKNLSKTERFPYGIISLRDNLFTGIPEALPLQSSMAFHAVVRGWLIPLCYLYEEDEGDVIPHIPMFDILNTYWVSGSRGLLWFCAKRFASPEDVKDEFDEDVKPDMQGRIPLWNVWDKESFGTIAENSWLKRPERHELEHIPALILPVGSTPFTQSEQYPDTWKDVGVNFATNNRNLYDIESRMGSYLLTMTGMAAKAPLEAHFDSTKGGKSLELEGRLSKGSWIPVDDGKGQKIETIVTPELTRDAQIFFDYLQGRLSVGGQTPIAFGQINQALPAAGINLLRHASMDNIKPPQTAMEMAYKWLAHECVSQYKSGGFGKMTIQGIDGSNRRFRMDVKPSDIDDSWQFEAELLPDMPQDDMANMGMAVQAVQAELLSHQSARDKYNLVDDTDLEQQNIDREKAYGVAGIVMRRVAAALKADGDDEGAQYILDSIEEMQQQKKGVASQPGSARPPMPSGTTTAAIPTPPANPNTRPSAARRFLSRFGGANQ